MDFSIILNALFDWLKIIHVDLLNKKTSKCSPENGENSSAENAKWSNTVLEVKISLSVLDTIVVSGFSWIGNCIETTSSWHCWIVFVTLNGFVPTGIVRISWCRFSYSSEYL